MKAFIIATLNLINRMIPKGNTVIFNSFPDLEGNALALYKYIAEKRPGILDRYDVIWTVNSDNTGQTEKRLMEIDGRGTHKVLKKLSLKGLFAYFRASRIITTHNYITGLYTAKGQTHYNLWHGMPFKAGGNRLKNLNSQDPVQGDILITCSDLFKNISVETEGFDPEEVIITGQPSDDSLLEPRNALERLGINKSGYKKVLVWCPTYRESDMGGHRVDGKTEDVFGVEAVLSGRAEGVDEALKNNNILLLVKFHPMDILRNISFPDHENIRIVSQEAMKAAEVTVNELMGDCDILITDYSSAFISFMLTGKPVLFVIGDVEDYKANRGFNLDDPDRLIAGEKVYDAPGFIDYINNMDEVNEGWRDKYLEVQGLMHKYTDGRSSERVCRLIFGEEDG